MVSILYCVIDTMCISTHEKKGPILMMQLRKSIIFLFARGVQLDNGVHPRPGLQSIEYFMKVLSQESFVSSFLVHRERGPI